MLGIIGAYLIGRSDGRREDEHLASDPDLLPTDAEARAWSIVIPFVLVLGVIVAVLTS